MEQKISPLPELLAPAGSPEALEAAIAAGADAVYLGATAFSNRMRAQNFTAEQLADALHLTKRYGVNSYITINTRVRDDEMEEVLTLAKTLLREGCTGFIVADMGIAAQLHSRFPEAMLHASTQMTLANAADARMMATYGFTRMVVPREISLPELARLKQDSPLEIEMFVHGAYCVSVSGQCLMSWAMGGRSGNRGQCAQPCRMVYRAQRGEALEVRPPRQDSRDPACYPLSLKDMCLASHIPALIEAGVDSLKIEGRQKPASYVYGVTKIYRTLLDQRRCATPEEIRQLDALFSRNGFTDGYFTAANKKTSYANMGGIRPTTLEQKKLAAPSETPAKYDLSHRARRCTFRMVLSRDEAVLHMTDSATGTTVTVWGDAPQVATGTPLTAEAAAKNLGKLGGTPFILAQDAACGGMEISVEDGLWYPASAINGLRRAAVEKMESVLFDTPLPPEAAPFCPTPGNIRTDSGRDSLRTAVLYSTRQWVPWLTDVFDTVYMPADDLLVLAKKAPLPAGVGAMLPPLVFEEKILRTLIEKLTAAGCSRVMFHSPGQLLLLREAGIGADGSFRLNIWNSDACARFTEMGAARLTASPEMSLGGLRHLAEKGQPCGAIVYGHIPLMLTERCILNALPPLGASVNKESQKEILCGGCGGRAPTGLSCGSCSGWLTDRLGNRFPILAKNGESMICNSLPVWMGDKMDTLPPLTHREYHFTIETPEEIAALLEDEKHSRRREGRRLK